MYDACDIMYHVQVEYVHDQHASRQHDLQRVYVGLTTLQLRGFVRQHLAGKILPISTFLLVPVVLLLAIQKYLSTEI